MSSQNINVLAELSLIANGDGDIELMALRVRAAVAELIESCNALIEEWDRQDDGRSKFDPMPAKDWFSAEARFRSAVAIIGGAA